jgi:hypothetical protein
MPGHGGQTIVVIRRSGYGRIVSRRNPPSFGET